MMAAFTQLANSINNALNGFLDPENMCLDTNILYIRASDTEIGAKQNFFGGHFKIKMAAIYRLITTFPSNKNN
jgi:hypothetical protein